MKRLIKTKQTNKQKGGSLQIKHKNTQQTNGEQQRTISKVTRNTCKMTCSVRDQPDVCECVLNIHDFIFLGLKCSFIWSAHNLRAALILAISM